MKLPPETLAGLVTDRTGRAAPEVAVGPAYGEDAALVDDGDRTLVASADPVSLTAARVGQIAVAVATNDVAASGGRPAYLLVTILLPDPSTDQLDRITADLDAAADRLGVAIVGGHTEVVSALDRPLLSATCLGFADRPVPTGGAEPDDELVLAGSAGIEATAVLAAEFGDNLGLPETVVDRALDRFDDLSVLPAAAALGPTASAMTDPTEGGVIGAAAELAAAAGVDVDIDRDAVPVADDTRRVCSSAGVDPLRSLGSGALLAAVPPDCLPTARAAASEADSSLASVGRVTAPGG